MRSLYDCRKCEDVRHVAMPELQRRLPRLVCLEVLLVSESPVTRNRSVELGRIGILWLLLDLTGTAHRILMDRNKLPQEQRPK